MAASYQNSSYKICVPKEEMFTLYFYKSNPNLHVEKYIFTQTSMAFCSTLIFTHIAK